MNKKICIHKYLQRCKSYKLQTMPGLADFLRGTIAILKFSKKYNYEVFIDKNIHPFFSYFEMSSNYIECENQNKNEIINEIFENYTYDEMYFLLENLFKKNESFSVITNSFYTKNENGELENWGEINDNDVKDYLKSILQPINIVKEKIDYIFKEIYKLDKNKKYKVIHLRMGDHYLINDKFINNDLLINYNKILNIINYYNNENNNYILISDSKTIAKKLKNLIPQLLYWDNEKIHIGALNGNENNLLDTIIDFFIMSKSDEIIGNGSGFGKIVSCIYDIKYSHYL